MTNNETAQETLFSIETGYHTWYVDYDRENDIYLVCKDERLRCTRDTLGEALEYIFNTLGGTSLKLIAK
jgi:hypothetical protein